MLAVVEIAERQIASVKVGDTAKVRLVTGANLDGTVRFISQKASAQTRTYRVEIALTNPAGTIPDGVTCEVALSLAPVPAARVPRSALTFSSDGKLGVRIVKDDGTVAFVPVDLVEDGTETLWVVGPRACRPAHRAGPGLRARRRQGRSRRRRRAPRV